MSGATDPGVVSVAPVLATLVVALVARNVLAGLFVGVAIGVALLGTTTLAGFLPALVRDHLVAEVADAYHASVLVLLACIGGFVKLVETSGGGAAFAASVTRFVSSRARAQLGAWFGGVLIFFSDLGTPLIVGPVFQSIVDRLGVSRQKLAFILDSTASPVAILIPFIGWGVFIMSVIADAFTQASFDASEWDAFVAAIPYQLYAWLAISVIPVLAWLDRDFGPMAVAEAAARENAATGAVDTQQRSRGAILVWLPLIVLGVVLFATLAPLGFPFARVSGADFRAGLTAAYLSGAGALLALLTLRRLKSLGEAFADYVSGMNGMMSIAAMLVLAWTLGSLSEALGTGAFVAEVAGRGVAPWALPALVFVLAALISFAMGSSWGTFVVMMPLAVPAALATGAPMEVTIGAVLSGGLFGDHASPLSETTLLSASGAGVAVLDHFRTQLPYALGNGVLALAGYVVAGAGAGAWVLEGVLVVQLLGANLLARRRRRDASMVTGSR